MLLSGGVKPGGRDIEYHQRRTHNKTPVVEPMLARMYAKTSVGFAKHAEGC